MVYYTCMRDITNIDGQKIRVAVLKTGLTREKVVVLVQEDLEIGVTFSLAGLDKMIRGELPKRDAEKVLVSLAKICGCLISDFAESKVKTA
jgi:hypothetical protein